MSYIFIGDVHGTDNWKDVVNEYKTSDSDVVVFLGDYVDSYDVPPELCLENLSDIFAYTCSTPNVHMLIGNHDYHYMRHDSDRYSGYQHSWMKAYRSMLLDNYKLLDMTYTFKYNDTNYVCSHAGVSQVFLDKHNTTVEELNNLWKTNPSIFGFNHIAGDYYGEHPSQSPLWIRPGSLLDNAVKGYDQIVGHTMMDYTTTYYTMDSDRITIVCNRYSNDNFLLLQTD